MPSHFAQQHCFGTMVDLVEITLFAARVTDIYCARTLYNQAISCTRDDRTNCIHNVYNSYKCNWKKNKDRHISPPLCPFNFLCVSLERTIK